MGRKFKYRYSGTNREREHRVTAEMVLGRKLQKSEEVHHVDEDTFNNNNQNLVICSRAFHKYLHFRERLRASGHSPADLRRMHHEERLPLEEIRRRLGLGEGMIGRWFRRLNIPVRPQHAWWNKRDRKLFSPVATIRRAKQLYADGLPIAEISREIDRPFSTVSAWVKEKTYAWV